MKKLLLLLLIISLTGCLTDSKNAYRVLDEAGYTEIQITGYKCFSCSEDDTYSTGFKAKSPSGKIVTGAVCGGFFKSHTIRLD